MVHHRTTALPVSPHCKLLQFIETPTKQTEEALLTQTLALLPPLLIFGRTPKCFDTAVWLFFEFQPWTENHIYMLTYSTVIFYLLFGCPKTNFGSLSRRQPQSPDVNDCIFIIFWLKGHWEPRNNEFVKTRDRLQTDPQTHRLTDIGKLMNTKK